MNMLYYIILYIIIAILFCIALTVKDYKEVKGVFGNAPIFKLLEPSDFLKANLLKSALWPLYICYSIIKFIINFIVCKL